jgi:hypothetical protein
MNYKQRCHNENSIESFAAPYEACKDAHAIAVLTRMDELQIMIGRNLRLDAKPAFVLMEEMY